MADGVFPMPQMVKEKLTNATPTAALKPRPALNEPGTRRGKQHDNQAVRKALRRAAIVDKRNRREEKFSFLPESRVDSQCRPQALA
ncbi:MAG TPA: hypothetical protein VK844_02325, partial [Hyphomicrobiales bacterium]|nr:hypothetical protein [Hyphomicrobiales bacterium]